MWTQGMLASFACKAEYLSSSKYYENLRNVLREALKKSVQIFHTFPPKIPALPPLIGCGQLLTYMAVAGVQITRTLLC